MMTIFWIIIAVVNTFSFLVFAGAVSDIASAWKAWIVHTLVEQGVNSESGSPDGEARGSTEPASASEDRARE